MGVGIDEYCLLEQKRKIGGCELLAWVVKVKHGLVKLMVMIGCREKRGDGCREKYREKKMVQREKEKKRKGKERRRKEGEEEEEELREKKSPKRRG